MTRLPSPTAAPFSFFSRISRGATRAPLPAGDL